MSRVPQPPRHAELRRRPLEIGGQRLSPSADGVNTNRRKTLPRLDRSSTDSTRRCSRRARTGSSRSRRRCRAGRRTRRADASAATGTVTTSRVDVAGRRVYAPRERVVRTTVFDFSRWVNGSTVTWKPAPADDLEDRAVEPVDDRPFELARSTERCVLGHVAYEQILDDEHALVVQQLQRLRRSFRRRRSTCGRASTRAARRRVRRDGRGAQGDAQRRRRLHFR